MARHDSVFLQNVHHAYAQTDGTYKWPNSREGDLLKQAYFEIGVLLQDATRLKWLTEDHAESETRDKCREILDRLSVMSYSAACTDIDNAMYPPIAINGEVAEWHNHV